MDQLIFQQLNFSSEVKAASVPGTFSQLQFYVLIGFWSVFKFSS